MTAQSVPMLIRDLNECAEFPAGDNTMLREFFHPDKQEVAFRYSLAHAMLKPGAASQPHTLKTSEVYYILEGSGIMHIGSETREVHEGQAVYIPPNAKQYIENTGRGDIKFLCIVDPAWRKEDEVVGNIR